MKKRRSGIRQGAQDLLGDVLRKVPLSGVAELRLPADIRRLLANNIENLREAAVEIFAREISNVLSKVDVQHIVDDALQNYTLRLEAKIELRPKDGAPERQPRKGARR